MVRILCYGDSNTWGAIPGSAKGRYAENERFPKRLQALLGNEYEVIEEGLRARTTDIDDIKIFKGNRNGFLTFPQLVWTHDPLDYIVLFLGTNDMKDKFNVQAKDSAKNIEKYIKYFHSHFAKDLGKIPQIIIVAPGEIRGGLFDGFNKAEEKSKHFNSEYEKIAKKHKCLFVDNSGLVAGSDGIHLTKESHEVLANKLAMLIKNQKTK